MLHVCRKNVHFIGTLTIHVLEVVIKTHEPSGCTYLTPNKFHRHKGRLLYMYEQVTHIAIKATVYRTSANQMFPISSITSINRFVFLIWVTKIRRFICWLAPDWRHQWSLPWWHFFQLCSPKHWGERYWSVFPCVWPGRFTKHCRGFLSFLEDKIFFSLHMDDK